MDCNLATASSSQDGRGTRLEPRAGRIALFRLRILYIARSGVARFMVRDPETMGPWPDGDETPPSPSE